MILLNKRSLQCRHNLSFLPTKIVNSDQNITLKWKFCFKVELNSRRERAGVTPWHTLQLLSPKGLQCTSMCAVLLEWHWTTPSSPEWSHYGGLCYEEAQLMLHSNWLLLPNGKNKAVSCLREDTPCWPLNFLNWDTLGGGGVVLVWQLSWWSLSSTVSSSSSSSVNFK